MFLPSLVFLKLLKQTDTCLEQKNYYKIPNFIKLVVWLSIGSSSSSYYLFHVRKKSQRFPSNYGNLFLGDTIVITLQYLLLQSNHNLDTL